MSSPYSNLEPRGFWRTGVTERPVFDPGDLYRPKFPVLRKARIATAGSCFAQHVGRTLKAAGFNVQDLEALPPALMAALPPALAEAQGYGVYSARYGNIYTVRQLLQLFQEAMGDFTPSCPIWEKNGRFHDAMRPSVEPSGFAAPEEVARHRSWHLKAVRKLLETTDVMVYTFGLTEAWVSRANGTVYPTAPGTIAGRFDPEQFEFKNFNYSEILADFIQVRDIMRSFNPMVRFIVTVSPVPLTAIASGQHVEVATTYSKAVLRAVCGALQMTFGDVDYFPSFEVITSQAARGMYYETNLRSVNATGVKTAMDLFMAAHGKRTEPVTAPRRNAPPPKKRANAKNEALICEDALLEAFNK